LSALLLSIESLNIFKGERQLASLPQLVVEQGKAIGIIGESGSGKSLTLLSIASLLPSGLIAKGSLIWSPGNSGVDLTQLKSAEIRSLLGKQIGMVFQEPMSALNPQRTCGWQLQESLRIHNAGVTFEHAKLACIEALKLTGIEDPDRIYGSYPHQISGGQRQRVMIAMATINKPALVLADEPTTALDPQTGVKIMQTLVDACKLNNSSLLVVSHDIVLLSKFCSHIVVMRKGETIVSGTVEDVLGSNNRHAYVNELLNSIPKGARNAVVSGNAQLIGENLGKTYKMADSAHMALEDIRFELAAGETLAVIGYSGSGKSTLAKLLTGLDRADTGSLFFRGENILNKRPTGVQMVFQDPYSSLNVSMRNSEIVSEVLRLKGVGKPECNLRCEELFNLTGLDTALMQQFPSSLSGGQRQRLCIARALASNPQVLILDEAIAALDPLVQKQILDLLLEIQKKTGIIYIFITHSPEAAEYMSSQVLCLEAGKVHFYGRAENWFTHSGGA